MVTRVYFYYFSKSYDSIPTQNTKEKWPNIYFIFRQLRTTHKEDNLINSKRKRDDNQHDSLFDSYDVVAKANPPVSQKIYSIIGNFFDDTEARQLFGCKG